MCSTKEKIGIRANKACMWFPVGVAFRSNWGWGLPEACHFFQEAVKARQDVMMFQPERLHFTFQKCNQKSMVHGGFVELSRIFAPTHMFHHHVPNPMHIYPHNISSKSSLNTWFIRVPLHLTQLRSISHSIQHWFAWTQLMRFRLRINQPLNRLIIEYSQAPSIYQYNNNSSVISWELHRLLVLGVVLVQLATFKAKLGWDRCHVSWIQEPTDFWGKTFICPFIMVRYDGSKDCLWCNHGFFMPYVSHSGWVTAMQYKSRCLVPELDGFTR